MKLRFLSALLLVPAFAFAMPPQPLPGGGVSCNPGCGVMNCGNGSCVVCNSEGCIVIKTGLQP